jgi:putative glutamine amidotransferase
MDMEDPLRAKAICHLHYIDAVARAGGLPVVIPPYEDPALFDECIARLDGFCFIGGDDYDPSHYGEESHRSNEVMPRRRHDFDVALAERVLDHSDKPVLGICGGLQLFNIVRGGALIQDIASGWTPPSGRSIPHNSAERVGTAQAGNVFRHPVRVVRDSRLARVLGSEALEVNSWHHQAIDPRRLGSGLVVTAHSDDGVIEAIEGDDGKRFVVAIQWHPERMQDDARQRALFAALVDEARTATRR